MVDLCLMLAEPLQSHYALSTLPTVTFIRDGQGQSRIFRVETAASTAILRLYGPQTIGDARWIEGETAFLHHLHNAGIRVAAPIPLADGRLVSEINDGERNVYASLFTFAEGNPQWPPTEAQSYGLGAALARLHRAADSVEFPSKIYDIKELIEQPIARMLPFVTEPADREYLQHVGTTIAQRLNAIPQHAPTYGMIHGDVHQGNAHFSADDAITLFDFSLCGRGWRVYDFTGFLWPLRDETITKPEVRLACDGFLAGYEAVRPLEASERAAIPACVKVRDLWETGDWIVNDHAVEATVLQDWMKTLLTRFRATPLE